MSVIDVCRVSKSYGQTVALKDVSFKVEAGEIFALLGPNGAGKTTMVEILEGYRRADAGDVAILDCNPSNGGSEWRSRIGIVLQQTATFERMRVREMAEMFADLYANGLTAASALEFLALGEFADSYVAELSGGQRRRLDVACAIVGRPEVLFLDEPSTGLDPEARRRLWAGIVELRDRGTTIILTTHHLEEAEALADRVGVLLAGELVRLGSPAAIGNRMAAHSVVRFRPSAAMDLHGWERRGDWVSMACERPGQLIADLVHRHGELEELTVSRPSLEEAYFQIVSGDAGELEATPVAGEAVQ